MMPAFTTDRSNYRSW